MEAPGWTLILLKGAKNTDRTECLQLGQCRRIIGNARY